VSRSGVLLGILLASVLWARSASCAIERFALLVGNDTGAEHDAALKYAESDADRMARVLRDVGGFQPGNVTVLRGETADTVQRTLIALNDRIRSSVARPGTQVVLLVYYSGHADARALHLGASRLELLVLEQLVRSSSASFRVLVVDACRSGALTRVKGGRPAPSFAVRVDEQLSGEGVVFLTSSSANEDAQESDEIQGSFFTHYFRSGLLGAADDDGDGRVTLDEAYRHAHASTLRASSRTWAGLQHPTFRYELRGQGELVLSELPRADGSHAALSFPAGRDYLVMAADAHGPVVAEVSRHALGRTISVRPGSYFVRGRASDFLLEGPLAVDAGERLEVADARLSRVQYARLARKGSDSSIAHGPIVGYTFRTALPNATEPCHGAFVAYPFALPGLTATPRLSACRSGFENDYLRADVDEYGLELELSHAWDLPIVSLQAGVAAGGALLEQTFDTPGRASARRNLAGSIAANLGAAVDLAGGFYLLLEGGLQSYAFRISRGTGPSAAWEASLELRTRAGLGWYW
jgi:caspase domain-containing protein